MEWTVRTIVIVALVICHGNVSSTQNMDLSAIPDSYKQVNCSFRGGDFCGWYNLGGNDVNWIEDNAGYYSYYAYLDFNYEDPGSVGRLHSPWLDALPGYTCTLQFRHYIGISGRCRLSLYQQQSGQGVTLIWNSTQASILQNTPIERSINCTGLRYRVYFKGERLSDFLCGDPYNGIALDDIVYDVTPLPTTTTSTTSTTQSESTSTIVHTSTHQSSSTVDLTSSASNIDNGTLAQADSRTAGLQSSSLAGIVIAVIVAVVVVVAAVIIIILIRRHGTEKAWVWVSGVFKIPRKQPPREDFSQRAAHNAAYFPSDQFITSAPAQTTNGSNDYHVLEEPYANLPSSSSQPSPPPYQNPPAIQNHHPPTNQTNPYELAQINNDISPRREFAATGLENITHDSVYEFTEQADGTARARASVNDENTPEYYNQGNISGNNNMAENYAQVEKGAYNRLDVRGEAARANQNARHNPYDHVTDDSEYRDLHEEERAKEKQREADAADYSHIG